MQPVEAVVQSHVVEVTVRKLLEESRCGDANTGRQTHHLALGVHRDVDVDVILDGFDRLFSTTYSVDRLTIASPGRREIRYIEDQNAFGSFVRCRVRGGARSSHEQCGAGPASREQNEQNGGDYSAQPSPAFFFNVDHLFFFHGRRRSTAENVRNLGPSWH